jgi:hypothetical protein
MFKPPRQPSKEDLEEANYVIKTSGLEAERQERLRREEAQRQEISRREERERKKQAHFNMLRESNFKSPPKRERERMYAERAEEKQDRKLGIVRAPAIIPSFESLSRDVVKKHYNYTDLPKNDPQRIIIEGNYGGKRRKTRKNKKSKRRNKSKYSKKRR